MSVDVKVHTAELTLTTVKLTPKILKQLPRLGYDQMRTLLKPDRGPGEFFQDGVVVGWIHGSVFGGDSDYKRFLLLKTGDGYGLYDVMESTIQRCGAKQIFVQ